MSKLQVQLRAMCDCMYRFGCFPSKKTQCIEAQIYLVEVELNYGTESEGSGLHLYKNSCVKKTFDCKDY